MASFSASGYVIEASGMVCRILQFSFIHLRIQLGKTVPIPLVFSITVFHSSLGRL